MKFHVSMCILLLTREVGSRGVSLICRSGQLRFISRENKNPHANLFFLLYQLRFGDHSSYCPYRGLLLVYLKSKKPSI